jgi:uncharacterized protein (DUF433 family)
MGDAVSIFEDQDPREVPLYTVPQAAWYVGLPHRTLRAWAVGQTYPRGRTGRFKPLVSVGRAPPVRLTFNNLIEAYVLKVLTREHAFAMSEVQTALASITAHFGDPRPLLSPRFATDGVSLYLEAMDGLVEISHGGRKQLVLRELIDKALKRIRRDERGLAFRLYPFRDSATEPFVVAIDPTVSFGKPTMEGTGVSVAIVADLIAAGEKPKRVAAEFGLKESDVGVAVEWHQREAA